MNVTYKYLRFLALFLQPDTHNTKEGGPGRGPYSGPSQWAVMVMTNGLSPEDSDKSLFGDDSTESTQGERGREDRESTNE